MDAKLLQVDLNDKTYKVADIPDKVIRQYLGGRGLGAYLLYQLLPARVDPLSKDVDHWVEELKGL